MLPGVTPADSLAGEINLKAKPCSAVLYQIPYIDVVFWITFTFFCILAAENGTIEKTPHPLLRPYLAQSQ
jgi:hypothetical protein